MKMLNEYFRSICLPLIIKEPDGFGWLTYLLIYLPLIIGLLCVCVCLYLFVANYKKMQRGKKYFY